jgi:hypothetical protein
MLPFFPAGHWKFAVDPAFFRIIDWRFAVDPASFRSIDGKLAAGPSVGIISECPWPVTGRLRSRLPRRCW